MNRVKGKASAFCRSTAEDQGKCCIRSACWNHYMESPFRGIISVEILKRIEELTGKRTFELFDLVCGSSTGAILSFLLCAQCLSIDEAEEAYRVLSLETFKQNKIVGRGKLFMAQSYYDTGAWIRR
eukprot:m.130319 g.130319  ORF g.130319 m.130319 type:complete len:126 (+) comp38021_c0_seq2:453-830(+)